MPNDAIHFFQQLSNLSNEYDFGELSYQVVSANGLGLNPNDILSRKAIYSPEGTRVCLDIFGTFSGSIQGSFNGTDYLKILPEGEAHSNVHGVIVTNEGENIAVKVLGRLYSKGDVFQHIELRHYGEKTNWVNSKHIFAKGFFDQESSSVHLKLYAFDKFPLENGFCFPDPDSHLVDYENFPFNLEQLKEEKTATIIYAGQGHLNSVESFGADVNKVFTGQFPIPKEGLRLNGFFSGPTAGSVNGVISGRNFLKVMPDGSMKMNSKIIARTLVGETLLLEALGASFPKTGTAWFETSRAVCNLQHYAHLTNLYNVGVGSTDVNSKQIIYNHYGYNHDPFN